MARIVFWVLLAAIVWYAWRQWQRRTRTARDGGPTSGSKAVEAMVPCAVCGLNVPRSEARPDAGDAGRFYCSDAHLQASRR